jgi:hypothetical protein
MQTSGASRRENTNAHLLAVWNLNPTFQPVIATSGSDDGGSIRLRAKLKADAASVVLTIGVQFDATVTVSTASAEALRAKAEAIRASTRGEMDCFAEPVIGRAFARPVGSQWRREENR